MNVRVDLNYPIKGGTEVVFRSPVDCSQVTGLKVYYISEDGIGESKEFAFADAHGNNVGDVDHLFAENVVVKVILDVAMGMAYVQNADTNAYLEGKFKDTINKCCPSFAESGAVVVCEPVDGHPLNIVSHIQAAQAGTGDPSPDNIRPITGYNAVNVWRGGKNLAFDFNTRYVKDGAYVGKANTQSQEPMFYADLKQGETYTVSCNQVNDLTTAPPRNTLMVRYPDGTNAYNGTVKYETDFTKQYAGLHSITFTASITGRYQFDYWVHTFSNDVTYNNFQLEVGTVATSYEPYRGETFTIDLGQTVYGGYVDWERNKCVLTKKGIAFDGTEKWSIRPQNSQGAYPCYVEIADCKMGYKTSICNIFANMNNAWDLFGAWTYSDHTNFVRKYFNTVCATLEDWKAYLAEQYASGTPVTVVYELAEPIEYDLADAPKEILAIAGTNTIYSDTGNTDVSGKADPNVIIQDLYNKLNALSATMTALTGV